MSINCAAGIALRPVGHGLHRPECVLAAENGDVYIPDWRGGVAVIRADGSQQAWLAVDPPITLRPNGIAFLAEGSFLIANLGDDGGLWAMSTDGALRPVLTAIGGRPLPPANFVTLDDEECIWATVSTTRVPRQAAWRRGVCDGFVVRIARDGAAAIVADGLDYTNEARVDPTGQWLYVVETFGRRLIRFPIGRGGGLGDPALVRQFGDGMFPDGFAFDVDGGIWITSLLSNRLVRLTPDGREETMVEELNVGHVAPLEAAYARDMLPPDALGPIPGARLQHVTSIAFGGPARTSAWLGALHNDCVFRFEAPVAGAPLPYWRFPLP